MLESLSHDSSLFCTLTYDEENYPNDGSLSVKAAQDFIKRARYYSDSRLRYFICGEYGSRTRRAHYHAIIFGTSSRDIISQSWKSGYVHIGDLTPASAAYCCNYVTKKIKGVAPNDDRTPEFALQSRKPGLGAEGIKKLVSFFETREGAEYIAQNGDIPSWIRWNQKKWPIGRYLKTVLRAELGFTDTRTPTSIIASAAGSKAAQVYTAEDRERLESSRRQNAHNVRTQVRLLREKETL